MCTYNDQIIKLNRRNNIFKNIKEHLISKLSEITKIQSSENLTRKKGNFDYIGNNRENYRRFIHTYSFRMDVLMLLY